MTNRIDKIIARGTYAGLAQQVQARRAEIVCTYCKRLIDPDEDSQRIAHGIYAHTDCAFEADEAHLAALDDEERRFHQVVGQ